MDVFLFMTRRCPPQLEEVLNPSSFNQKTKALLKELRNLEYINKY